MRSTTIPLRYSQKFWLKILVVFLIIISVYFLIAKAFPKLIYTQANYGEYYWARGPWLLIHTIAGIVATVIGPFQFMKKFRNRHMTLHRNIGKAYLVCVVIAAVTSIHLAYTSGITTFYTIELISGGFAWLLSCIPAYVYARKHKIKKHQEWMTRNYVLTFFFIIFFGFFDLFKAMGVRNFEALASVLPLATLSIPLVIAEVYLREKRKKKSPVTERKQLTMYPLK